MSHIYNLLEFRKKHKLSGNRYSLNGLLMFAISESFKAFPQANCTYSKNSIQKAVKLASSIKFKKKILKSKFFFGNGNSSEKILRQVLKIKINEQLLRKK